MPENERNREEKPPQEPMPPESRPHDVPVQTPPPGLGEMMDRMKERADAYITEAKKIREPAEAFLQGALLIHGAMRPKFGPANAWLFNERDAKIRALAEALGLTADEAQESVDFAAVEEVAHDLELLLLACETAGLDAEVTGVDRGALLWTPTKGYAVMVVDRSKEAERNPKLTLFLFPPVPGSAVRNQEARELPGEPLFHMAGGLTGFTQQGPRPRDVAPEAILATLLEELRPGALFHVQKGAIELICTASGDALESVEVRDGLIRARGKGDPPSEGLEGLKPCALLWSAEQGGDVAHRLVYP